MPTNSGTDFVTKIPALSDDADVQVALKIFLYGSEANSSTGVGLLTATDGTEGLAGHLNTMKTATAAKLPLSGGTVTGNITASTAPSVGNHLANKTYVDNEITSTTSYVDARGPATPVGAIIAFAGTSVPSGWLTCDGSTFSAGTYPELNTVLGGTTLPDLTDRFLRGSAVAGATGGSNTISTSHLPSHTHTINHNHTASSNSTGNHTHSVSGTTGSDEHTHTGTTDTDEHNHSVSVGSSSSHYHYQRGRVLSAFASGITNALTYDASGPHRGDDGGVHGHSASTGTDVHSHDFTTASDSHSHSFSDTSTSNGAHSHTITVDTKSTSSGSTGSGSAFRPQYYNVIYIIKAT